MTENQPTCISVQINQIDHTLAPPGPLDNSTLRLAPIIRIFGSSSTELKTCLHVHQVYPYFFIEYHGPLDPQHVKRYISKLTHSLNHAICVSLKRNPNSRNARFIRAIMLVKGIHFYGFHSSYSPFLKILLADPALLNRAATILRSGSVMSTRFTVFESHLGYILQFLSDFGLYGCGWVNLGETYERCHDTDSEDDTSANSNAAITFLPSAYHRQSCMPLELDVVAHQILNRHSIQARHLHHRLEIPAPSPPPDPLVPSVRELWDDERRRRVAMGLPPSPELPADPSDASRAPGGEWISEVRWWDRIRSRIAQEREQHLPLNSEACECGWETRVMTTFESTEALWEGRWKTWRPNAPDYLGLPVDTTTSEHSEDAVEIDVDLAVLESQDINSIDDAEASETKQFENEAPRAILEEDGHSDEDFDAQEQEEGLETEDNSPSRAGSQGPEPKPSSTPLVSESLGSNTPSLALASQVRDHARAPEPQYGATASRIDDADLVDIGSTTRPSVAFRTVSSGPSKRQKLSHHTNISDSGFAAIGSPSYQKRHRFLATPTSNTNSFEYFASPPSVMNLLESMEKEDIPTKVYRIPYYSNDDDVPERPREYAGLVYHIKGGNDLEDWQYSSEGLEVQDTSYYLSDLELIGGWEYTCSAPGVREIKKWLLTDEGRTSMRNYQLQRRTQLKGPTQASIANPKARSSGAMQDTVLREKQDMTILSLEIFAPSGDLLPDPNNDEIALVFYSFYRSDKEARVSGVVAVTHTHLGHSKLKNVSLETVSSEIDLLNRVVDIVVDFDPDILTGWDLQKTSWGYLNRRGAAWGLEISDLLSRAPLRHSNSAEQWQSRHTSTFKAGGRQVLNVWRIMRGEMALTSYSFENVAFHLLGRRIPRFAPQTMTDWYKSPAAEHISTLIKYFSTRTSMILDILDEAEIVTKTAEFARVFGVDFHSVISRGSQFKVESFMFRIAKPESFVLISPSKADVGKQNAAECMPLILEPQSAFYTSPLVVLDFQSLYPSVMIAYNYCYSTCLGRVTEFQGRYKFGVTELNLPQRLLEKLQEHIIVAPNGVMYVKPQVRKGLLGRMLSELLETRVMVKEAMKGVKNDKALRRILDARQLGLKYIANVTYGYTSATFSGRMPAVEIADSIVQTGRETLEKAIIRINGTKSWGAEVVYGDTDSLFIYLRGKSKEQAFRIGQEIADTITSLNPAPIKLKFEKVYLPCVLLAKKRYVGFKYEGVDQEEPRFDAKGIETVRRDGVVAQRKMTENCLKILFRTQDLTVVKDYCCDSWKKILEHRIPLQDFIFAKEVRMGTYSNDIPPLPGVTVAARRAIQDPNDEPQYGERVPYVIVSGEPFSKLADRAVDPMEMLNSPEMILDVDYYIARVLIPPLDRIFSVLGADVRQWYDDLDKSRRLDGLESPNKEAGSEALMDSPDRLNMEEHLFISQCLVCDAETYDVLCFNCRLDRSATLAALLQSYRLNEQRLIDNHRICTSCTGISPAEPVQCVSLDCPWLYERKTAERDMQEQSLLEELIEQVKTTDLNVLREQIRVFELAVEWDSTDSEGHSDESLPQVPIPEDYDYQTM